MMPVVSLDSHDMPLAGSNSDIARPMESTVHRFNDKEASVSPEMRRQRARRLVLGLNATTFAMLGIALFLTLFPLLPASQSGVSILQISPSGGEPPVGAERLNRTSVNGHIGEVLSEVAGDLPTVGGERLSGSVYVRAVDEGDNELVVVNGTRWMGRDGPTIEIGLMHICSRLDNADKLYCTPYADAAFHAAPLPFDLSSAIMDLTASPPAPILLIISALGLILAMLSVIIALLPWSIIFRPCKAAIPRFCHTRRAVLDDGESVRGSVVHHPSGTAPGGGSLSADLAEYGKTNYAVLAFGIPAFAVSIAAIVKAFDVVNGVRDRWNLLQAGSVGLRVDDGAAICIIAFAPFAILLALLAAAAPPIIKFIAKPGPHAAQHIPPTASSDAHTIVANGTAPHCALCEAAAKEVPADVFPGQVAPSAARDVPTADRAHTDQIEPTGYTLERGSEEPMRAPVPHRESHDAGVYSNASTERLIQPPPLGPNSAAEAGRATKPADNRKSWRESWRQVFGVGVAV